MFDFCESYEAQCACHMKEVVQSVLESIYGGSLHNVRSEMIPVVDYSLCEEVLSDIQSAWLFVYPELVSS